jgi:uncharacterized protein YndB with AHSA1/START domain
MDGTLDHADDRWELTFVRRLAHRPEEVWRALTEPEHLAAWFPTDIEGDRTAGAPLRFVFRNGEGPPTDGELLAYDPPSRLEYRWGEEILRFHLQPDGDGCLLTLVDVFDELGKAARDAAGWHACLDVLEHELAGEPAPWSPRERWQEVHEVYLERFGPEAATIGPPSG